MMDHAQWSEGTHVPPVRAAEPRWAAFRQGGDAPQKRKQDRALVRKGGIR